MIKPSSLGDVVHTLPAVNLIAKRYPQLEIRWVVHPHWAPLLEGNPSLAGLIPFPRDDFRGAAGACRFLRWGRSLKEAGADVALDFQGLLRSGLMGRMSGADRVVGMSDAREGARFFFDEVVSVDAAAHAVERYLGLAEAVGAPAEGSPPDFFLPEGKVPDVAGLEDEEFVLLHPYSRGKGKALSAEQCVRFCKAIAPARVVVAGVSPEGGCGDGELPANALDLSNRTGLLELIWLMRRARFCVSTDSGPMHLAAAVTDRLVGIHTWTDPRMVGPYREDAWVWKAGAVRRVRELESEDASLAGDRKAKISGITDGDIQKLAAFVGEQMG